MTDAPQVPFDLYTYTRSGATAAAVATSTTAATFFNTGIGWQNDVSGGDGNNGSGDNPAIPLPNQRAFEGPWFSQQLSLSIFIGVVSFFIFVIVRRRNAALFAPRTKLKGFSPLDDGHDSGYFGWIMPTLKTEEMRILQTVGLDAAILLSFLKMGFWLFFSLSCWSILVLMPVNYWQNGVLDGVSPAEDRDNATDPNAIRDTVTGVWTQLLASSLRAGEGVIEVNKAAVERHTSTSSSARNQSMRSGEMSRCVSSRSIMMNRLRSSSDRISCFTAASLRWRRPVT